MQEARTQTNPGKNLFQMLYTTSQETTCPFKHPVMFSSETVASSTALFPDLPVLTLHFPFALTLAFQGLYIPPKAIIKKKKCLQPNVTDPELKQKQKEKGKREEE